MRILSLQILELILTSNGLELGGTSGFQLKEETPEIVQKFRDDFRKYQWELEGTSELQIMSSETPVQIATVRSLHPSAIYLESPFVTYKYLYQSMSSPLFKEKIKGSLVSGTISDARDDDGQYLIYRSESDGSLHEIELHFYPVFNEPGKTFNLHYDISSSNSPDYIEIRSSDGTIASSTTGTLTGTCYNIPAPESKEIWVYSRSSSEHELKIDFIADENVVEEYETYLEVDIPTQYFSSGPDDTIYLELNRSNIIHTGLFNLMVHSCGQFTTFDQVDHGFHAFKVFHVLGACWRWKPAFLAQGRIRRN